mmetsp:Transcript_10544/g.22878  ORF Transcript_10544/g.22878 Transcript_10544/m.22878 type:complete len:338 (-) Transcript_10544:2741-3754(-)
MASSPSRNPARLPSDLVATIFEFSGLAIHQIMQIGISSRFVSQDVLSKMTGFVVWRTKDLDVPTARKLLNMDKITSISIGCLIKLAESSVSAQHYDVEASHRIPFFISLFPNLERVFIGGTCRLPVLATYEPYRCSSPADHREYHHGLLWALCGAFRTGVLSQGLEIEGLVYSGIYCLWNRDQDEPESCTFCNAVLRHFPIPMIIKYAVRSRGDSNLCYNERQIYEKLIERSGAEVWSTVMNDTVLHMNDEESGDGTAFSFTPAAVERISNLSSWGLGPDCSGAYWRNIRAKFTNNRITRTAFLVLQLVDDEVDELDLNLCEDNPRPRLRELLTRRE